jgi:starch synthase
LAKAIISVLQDDGLARRMGKIGRDKVTREFTWNAVAKRVDSIYDEVITG